MYAQIIARNGKDCISLGDSYKYKDALKALGYRFNGATRAWEHVIDPAHFMDLCGETAISCNLASNDLDALLIAIGEFQATERGMACSSEFTVDGLDGRYNAYVEALENAELARLETEADEAGKASGMDYKVNVTYDSAAGKTYIVTNTYKPDGTSWSTPYRRCYDHNSGEVLLNW